jgi:dynein heavy chain
VQNLVDYLQAKERLVGSVQEIQQTLAELHVYFEADSEDVQREWVKFTAKVDRKVEGALRHTVKRSLQELSRLLNGDSKTEVLPIFRQVFKCKKANGIYPCCMSGD